LRGVLPKPFFSGSASKKINGKKRRQKAESQPQIPLTLDFQL
jgi:hypothetical protein